MDLAFNKLFRKLFREAKLSVHLHRTRFLKQNNILYNMVSALFKANLYEKIRSDKNLVIKNS